jgi:dTDP-glucose 4,6-dehydratase
MTILVTGGAGFIGSNFVRWMLRYHPDDRVMNVDKLTYAGNLENLEDVEDNTQYHFIKTDICDRMAMEALFQKSPVSAIVNFAAESHVDRSILGAAEFIETNVGGTNVLLELAREYQVKRFIQVSTDEVYGSLGSDGKFTERTQLHPNSPYSASKASADLMALAYHHTFGIPVIVTRCSNNYGSYQFPEKLIPLMIANAIHDKPLPVYGDGLNVRDWLHVTDHCAAIDAVLQKGEAGQVYNIGGNNEWRNIDIVKLVLKHLGKAESLIRFVKDRPGHDRRYAIDSTRIQAELGWRPSYTFERGIKETVEWYLEHQGWWKKILSGEYKEYYKKQYEER